MDLEYLKNEKGKIIGTIIVSLLTSYLLFSTILNYYYGIKIKKTAATEEVVVINESNVPINSLGVLENYNKINFNACNSALSSIFYKNAVVDVDSLSNDEKLAIIYYYFSDNCGTTITVTSTEMDSAIENLFGVTDISFLSTTDFNVTTNSDNTEITIAPLNCNNCNNNITRQITKATTGDNNLYIYEEVSDGITTTNYKWTFTSNANNIYYFVSISNI